MKVTVVALLLIAMVSVTSAFWNKWVPQVLPPSTTPSTTRSTTPSTTPSITLSGGGGRRRRRLWRWFRPRFRAAASGAFGGSGLGGFGDSGFGGFDGFRNGFGGGFGGGKGWRSVALVLLCLLVFFFLFDRVKCRVFVCLLFSSHRFVSSVVCSFVFCQGQWGLQSIITSSSKSTRQVNIVLFL